MHPLLLRNDAYWGQELRKLLLTAGGLLVVLVVFLVRSARVRRPAALPAARAWLSWVEYLLAAGAVLGVLFMG